MDRDSSRGDRPVSVIVAYRPAGRRRDRYGRSGTIGPVTDQQPDSEWTVVSDITISGAAAELVLGDQAATFGPHVPPDAELGLYDPEPEDPLWWLSFCDPDKAPPPELQRPGGPSFLGAVITQAPTCAAAITRSHVLKVNPGGEIAIKGPIPARFIAAEWRDRLLSAAEIGAIPEPDGI